MSGETREERRRREAREALKTAHEGTAIGDTMLSGISDHFSAKDAPDDPIEIWGRRIGRILALVVVLGLIGYLVHQLTGAQP
jgi:hypothetical protein